MPPRVLVVDKSASTRDVIAELLGEHASEVVWCARDAALGMLRGGQPFDVIVLDSDPAPSPVLVRELASAGGNARVVLIASGADGIGLATRIGAADVIARPFAAAELAFRVGRVTPGAERDKRRPRKSDVIIGSGSWIKELYD